MNKLPRAGERLIHHGWGQGSDRAGYFGCSLWGGTASRLSCPLCPGRLMQGLAPRCSPPPLRTSSGLSPLRATKGGTRGAFGLAGGADRPWVVCPGQGEFGRRVLHTACQHRRAFSVVRGAGLWPVVLAAVFYKMPLAPQFNLIVCPYMRCPQGDAPSQALSQKSGDTAGCTVLPRGRAQPRD